MPKREYFSKTEALVGTGAGIGLVQVYLTRNILDALWGPIPGVGEALGVWGSWSTLGNMVIGGVAMGVSMTNVAKGGAKTFLKSYGFITLLGGILNGIFPAEAMVARMRGQKAGASMRGAAAGATRKISPIASSASMAVNGNVILT